MSSLRNCTERSLLVVDEFGKGTEALDGAGLFAGLCHHLSKLENKCPKAILATHFQHIFFVPDLVDSSSLVLAHMALVKTVQPDSIDFTFTFRYAPLERLVKLLTLGLPESRKGFCGIPSLASVLGDMASAKPSQREPLRYQSKY